MPKTVVATPNMNSLKNSTSHNILQQASEPMVTYDSTVLKGRSSVLATSEPPQDVTSMSRRSTNYLASSENGLSLVNRRHEVLRSKQERDLDRWKRTLQMEVERKSQNLEKERNILATLDRKSTSVLDMQARRQNELRMKNQNAMNRARANESKLFASRYSTHLQKQKVSSYHIDPC